MPLFTQIAGIPKSNLGAIDVTYDVFADDTNGGGGSIPVNKLPFNPDGADTHVLEVDPAPKVPAFNPIGADEPVLQVDDIPVKPIVPILPEVQLPVNNNNVPVQTPDNTGTVLLFLAIGLTLLGNSTLHKIAFAGELFLLWKLMSKKDEQPQQLPTE